jgi:FdhD protein
MEIRAHGPGERPRPVAVTLRTPGSDFELAAGFLLAEGVVDRPGDIASIAYCVDRSTGDARQEYNVVTVRTRAPVVDRVRDRTFASHAGCGLCGTTTLADLEVRCAPVGPGPVVDTATLVRLPEVLAQEQPVFSATGGLHASARFAPDGTLRALREDVGRHNALDKLIGAAALAGELPLDDDIVLLSGRAGFELVQKAAMAGVAVLASVSAVSSLAVATAERFGMTLVGFLREGRASVYTGAQRVAGAG